MVTGCHKQTKNVEWKNSEKEKKNDSILRCYLVSVNLILGNVDSTDTGRENLIEYTIFQ